MEPGTERSVTVPAGPVKLQGDLAMPAAARGVVLFAHGSGSGRQSPRNRYVAEILQQAQFCTLLLDLLTADEEARDLYTREYRFNLPLLAERLVAATDWLAANPETQALPLGYFGASTGAAAALIAATERPQVVRAVVSRGGRPDLALEVLDRVQAPTLLLVGGYDSVVIDLNREAYARLPGTKHLEIVPAATHLFEEPGTLEEVARLAAAWFTQYL
jgi:dienelactone hydrolase